MAVVQRRCYRRGGERQVDSALEREQANASQEGIDGNSEAVWPLLLALSHLLTSLHPLFPSASVLGPCRKVSEVAHAMMDKLTSPRPQSPVPLSSSSLACSFPHF